MLKKTELAVLVSALVWGGAVGATTAAPLAADQQFARESLVQFNGAITIAKQGADDGADPFDDHGANLVPQGPMTIAKNGADDGADPFDDHSANLVPQVPTTIAKHGADDGADPCDDHGTDLCRNVA